MHAVCCVRPWTRMLPGTAPSLGTVKPAPSSTLGPRNQLFIPWGATYLSHQLLIGRLGVLLAPEVDKPLARQAAGQGG